MRLDILLHARRPDVDQLQTTAALVQDAPRIAGPRRRPCEIGRQRTWCDQLARPASFRWSWSFLPLPLLTSTTCTWPSGSLNAMRDPSGDQALCIAAAEPRVIWRSTPLRRSRTQMFMKPLRSDEYA